MIELLSQEWKVTTDTVMGGLSTLSIVEGNDGIRLHGSLSHRNNGGFVSAKMLDGSIECPQKSVGVKVWWKGDGRQYRLILHERDRKVREYFECTLSQPTETLLWSDFTHRYKALSDTERRIRKDKLMSLGVLLSKTHAGTVDFHLEKVEWVFE